MASSSYEGAMIEGFALEGKLKRGQAVDLSAAGTAKKAADSGKAIGVYDIRDNLDVDASVRSYSVPVVVLGPARVFAQGALSAGDLLIVHSDGYLKALGSPTAGQKHWVVGRALGAAAKDEAVDILVQPFELQG
ncbi:MAG: hypothetical protein AAF975_00045 [Spirochaetota bacterium]